MPEREHEEHEQDEETGDAPEDDQSVSSGSLYAKGWRTAMRAHEAGDHDAAGRAIADMLDAHNGEDGSTSEPETGGDKPMTRQAGKKDYGGGRPNIAAVLFGHKAKKNLNRSHEGN